ncbi:MAG TPA: hypothetical protein VIL88_04655 [Devosia sp.]|jgi:hypothetical protein|uniref:hypothetical protein n=1 Tax=Devosia sp. TaxID=1871048 RepID=UPI002F928372
MTRAAPPEPDFVEMVESCLDSVWSLDLLLLTHAQPKRQWNTADLVAELRSSELVVTQSVRRLLEAGLLVDEGEGNVRYAAVSADLASFVDRLDHEYRTRPNQIRRMIVGRSNAKLTSFSDAFLLRKPPQ